MIAMFVIVAELETGSVQTTNAKAFVKLTVLFISKHSTGQGKTPIWVFFNTGNILFRINTVGGKCIRHILVIDNVNLNSLEISADVLPSHFGSVLSSTLESGLTATYKLPSIQTIYVRVQGTTKIKLKRNFDLLINGSEVEKPFRLESFFFKYIYF